MKLKYRIFLLFMLPLSALSQVVRQGTSGLFILGNIEVIHSTVLNEDRTLNIYLPEGYGVDDTVFNYPVVYLLDGSADEDFIHVVGAYQFASFDWVKRAPKSIIVGIANVDRKRDFTFPTTIKSDAKNFPTTGHSEKFIEFIEKELQPYISSKYAVSSSKTIIGESLGGLLATEILLKKPTLFDNYIIISPSIWWDNGSLLRQSSELLNAAYPRHTEIYIGVGKEGRTPGEAFRIQQDDAKALAEKIKALKNPNIFVYFDFLPDEDHATVAEEALINALKFLSGKKNSNIH